MTEMFFIVLSAFQWQFSNPTVTDFQLNEKVKESEHSELIMPFKKLL